MLYHGNDMVRFKPGDVFILGSNIPHLMKSSKNYFSSKSGGVYSVSLFFNRNTFGKQFFNIPELTNIGSLLQNCKRGISLSGGLRKEVNDQILKMSHVREEELIIRFLKILSTIRKANKRFINSSIYKFSIEEKDGHRLNNILNFTFSHLEKNIRVEDVAQIANLSKSQFSRYFKLHTGKTYIEFLNELRIESACTLLLDKRNTIENICYDVGYSNLSNFNRQFKKVKGVPPSVYRKLRDSNDINDRGLKMT
ncbi:AraC family transcriptional regulator [Sinomicrobium sp.]